MNPAPTGKVAVGHPVDVATGTLYHEFEDYTLPGNLPLTLRRRYSSARTGLVSGMFGPGWFSPLEMYLVRDLDGYRMVSEEGEGQITFDDPDDSLQQGTVIRNPGSFHELKMEHQTCVVTKWDPEEDEITCFVFAKGPPGEKWPLAEIRDLAGNAIQLAHDPKGRVCEVLQKRHHRGFGLVYDEMNRLIEVFIKTIDRNADAYQPLQYIERLILTYAYDADGRLCRMTDAVGQSCSYAYDQNNRMVREVDLGGMTYHFRFDQRGRCVETAGTNDFGLNQLEYSDEGRFTQVTDNLGHVTTYEWNEAGQVERETSPLGHAKATVFDEHGRIVQTVSSEGRTTFFDYDEKGDRIKVTAPSGATTQYLYNDLHQLIAITDPAGHTWRISHDEQNRISQVINPLGQRMTYGYNQNGDVATISDPAGSQRHFEWDAYGDLISATDWRGYLSAYQYDQEGKLVTVVDPRGYKTIAAYDALGRIVQIRQQDGTSEQFGWNAYNQPAEYTDQNGATTYWRYTLCGYVSDVISPDQGHLQFKWGLIPGRLEKIVNENNEHYTFTYDAGGRLIEEVDFAGRLTTYEYDSDDLAMIIKNAAGRLIQIERNERGMVTGVLYDDGSRTTYHYDERNFLIKAANAQCQVELSYDAVGRLIREKQGEHVIENTYDTSGNRISRQSSLGSQTSFRWNPNGFLDELTNFGFAPIKFAYDENQNEISRRYGKHTEIQQAYDSNNRLIEQFTQIRKVMRNGRSYLQWPNSIQRQYQYDPAGNLTRIKDRQTVTATYTYDSMGRVLSASVQNKLTEQFTYDAVGNIHTSYSSVRKSDHAAKEPQWRRWNYGPGNTLTHMGGTQYRYDQLGRMIEKKNSQGSTFYEWNQMDQMVAVLLPDGAKWRYAYDPFGRRIAKHGYSESVTYVWDGDVILHECHTCNGLNKKKAIHWDFDPLGFAPIAKIENNAQFLFMNDVAGTPVALLNKAGDTVWSRQYTAWGNLIEMQVSDIICPIRFQGQWYDQETGLHYNRHRYYDPDTGRFISPDPIGLVGGMNAYLYAPNAWSWVDPYGLSHEMTGEVFRNGNSIFSGEYVSGGIKGDNTFQTQLRTHTERKFLRQAQNIVQPNDVLEMRGFLNSCRPGCQPEIRRFVESKQVTVIYHASETGLTYKWSPYSHDRLNGTVLQQVYNKKGQLIESWRYWRRNGRSARAPVKCE